MVGLGEYGVMTTLTRRRARGLSDLIACAGTLAIAWGAAGQGAPSCDAPEVRALDFWIGDWDVAMNVRGGVARAHNTPILDACVIEENFYYPSGRRGLSWSRFVPASKKWKQVWVDSGGSFQLFVQDEEAEDVTFINIALDDGAARRMRWENIEEDSLEWRYEKESAEGWETALHTSFTRRDEPAQPFGEISVGDARPASDAFDFWIGEWDLTWQGGTGTNTIAPILGGVVLREDFAASNGFDGASVTTWDADSELWRQVWVDNQGGFLHFAGTMDDAERSLTLQVPDDAPRRDRVTRMRWHDVTDDSFTWSYESKELGETAWKSLWRIEYVRRVVGSE